MRDIGPTSRNKCYICIKETKYMAVYFKTIPTLRGKAAERFVRQADENAAKYKGSIDFSEQMKMAKQILAKASHK